jgi:hypothetical protein
VYTALALHAAAQLPEVDEDDALEDEDEEDDEDDEEEELEDPLPLSGPIYCQRVVVVGFQPVEV